MTAELKILTAGPHSSLQDRGRAGHQAFGVPEGGALDREALIFANHLVGNDSTAAGIETCLGNLAFSVTQPVLIALTGTVSDSLTISSVTGQERIFEPGKAGWLRPGEVARLGFLRASNSAFIACGGQFALEPVFGSLSTSANASLGGHQGRLFTDGDVLAFTPHHHPPQPLQLETAQIFEKREDIHLVTGPQQDWFEPASLERLLSTSWRLTSKMNRMGIRLSGVPLQHNTTADILSDGIVCGSVQVPADGQPIIMLNDHQTTGGYTKIGTIISSDLPAIARLSAGDKIRFTALSQTEAEEKARQHAGWINRQIALMTPLQNEQQP